MKEREKTKVSDVNEQSPKIIMINFDDQHFSIKLLNLSNNSALMQGVVGTGTLLLDLVQKGSLQFTTLIYRRTCCC